jgi:hypothetical protein
MTKKAVRGINDYPIDGADLRGCVNDANQWATLLVDHFDVPSGDVRVVLDADATKAGILRGRSGCSWCRRGTSWCSRTAHGSQIPDVSGDEPTYDECSARTTCGTRRSPTTSR